MHVRDKNAHTKNSKSNISKTVHITTKRQHAYNMTLNCMRQKKINTPATGGKFDWKVLVIASDFFFFDICVTPSASLTSPLPLQIPFYLFIFACVRACVHMHIYTYVSIGVRYIRIASKGTSQKLLA